MALREILASFGFDIDEKGLKKGDAGVDGLLEKISGFGKLAAGAFVSKEIFEFGHALLEEADALAKASQGLGLSTDHLQQLEHAAGLSGVGVDALRGALSRLQKGAAEAAEKGTSPVAASLKDLGIDVKNADGSLKSSGELFEAVGIAIGEIENPTKRAGVASKFFGKSYAQLLPLFAEGQEGIDKLKGEVEELGFAFDEAFLENAQEVNDNVDRLKKGLTGFAVQAIGPLLPDLVELTEDLVGMTKQFVELVRHSKIVSATLTGLGVKGVFALSAKIGGLGGALRALGSIVWRTILPFLALEDAFVFLAGGKSVIGDALNAAFGEGTANKVREWIADVTKEVRAFFDDLIGNPTKFKDDMMLVFEGLRTGKFWEFIFGKGALADWAQFWTDVVMTPQKAVEKFKKGLGGLLFGDDEVEQAQAGPKVATAEDLPSPLALKALNFIAPNRPGVEIAERLSAQKSDKEQSRLTAEQRSAGYEPPRFMPAQDADFVRSLAEAPTAAALAPTATAPVGPTNSNNTTTLTNAPTVNVTVAAGTPAEITRGVTRAAQKGATPDWAATKAALVTSGG